MGKRDNSIDNLVVYLSLLLDNIQIKGLADGTDLTDAVTLQQLNAIAVGQGWDEVVWDETTGDLKFYINSVLDFTVNLDDRYTTPADVTDIIEAAGQTVFTISLPAANSVAQRIAGAQQGIDYPSGWVLTDSGLDLLIDHSLTRYGASVTVFANTSGSEWQQLFNTAAYSGVINLDADNLKVQSLATVLRDIKIFIVFAQAE